MFEEKKICEGVSFRYAKGRSIVSGNEIHPYHEILYYIDGDTAFLSEKFSEKLQGGTLLIIPRGTYHNFRVENQDSYTRFVVNFDAISGAEKMADATMENLRIIKNPGRETVRILEKMCNVIAMPDSYADVALYGAFLELLYEICKDEGKKDQPEERKKGDFIARCISYTDENFLNPITSGEVAEVMGVSESTLLNKFKRELGISFHRYTTEKRMIYARKLIEDGVNPTQIFLNCGYGDYSSFYKAYVKMFGTSPSENKRR